MNSCSLARREGGTSDSKLKTIIACPAVIVYITANMRAFRTDYTWIRSTLMYFPIEINEFFFIMKMSFVRLPYYRFSIYSVTCIKSNSRTIDVYWRRLHPNSETRPRSPTKRRFGVNGWVTQQCNTQQRSSAIIFTKRINCYRLIISVEKTKHPSSDKLLSLAYHPHAYPPFIFFSCVNIFTLFDLVASQKYIADLNPLLRAICYTSLQQKKIGKRQYPNRTLIPKTIVFMCICRSVRFFIRICDSFADSKRF